MFCICHFSNTTAKTYFVSSFSGDDSRTAHQAQNQTTPWKTINRLNSFDGLQPGDSVLFRRGDTFYGSLVANISGTAKMVITYASYGTGPNPVISGLTTMTGWKFFKENIYYTSLEVSSLNLVIVNGIVEGMGRYPNSKYLKYETHIKNESITDDQLKEFPSWTGAEIVIRKYRWIIDRHVVTAHLGNTLVYNTLSTYGNNNAYQPVDGNGYFIQNHIGTLDKFGEWFYDVSSKRLYINFGSENPSSCTVKASSQDYNARLENVRNLTFSAIDFEGANMWGVALLNCENIGFTNFNISYQGGISVFGRAIRKVTLKKGKVNHSLSSGIYFEFDSHDCRVEDLEIKNTNMIAGTGRSGDGVGNGICIVGNNTVIRNSSVKNSGYSGIQFKGDNVVIENNYVDLFCRIKDDGAGIYTYTGDKTIKYSGRVIRNNFITNAVGAFAGVESYQYEPFGKAAGIYLDDFSNHTVVSNNTVANGEWAGIFLHNAQDNKIKNNLIYNFACQLVVHQSTPVTRNIEVTDNYLIAKAVPQSLIHFKTYVYDDPTLIGTFNNNCYWKANGNHTPIVIDQEYAGGRRLVLNVQAWQEDYNLDEDSYMLQTNSPLFEAGFFK